MELHDFLTQQLKSSWQYTLTDEDRKAIQIEKIEKFILRKLKSKKFRKTSIDPESENQINNAVVTNIKQGGPIRFTYPFGGYKIWRVPTYPNVDWAEFFTMAYVLSYVAPIVAAYEPGVELVFTSDDVIIEKLDNYPRADLDAYVSSFRNLVAEFAKYFPTNLTMSLQQIYDLYDKDEYDSEIEAGYAKFKQEGLSEERIAKDFKYSEFNFQIKGAQDFSSLSEDKLKELKLDLMLWSQAYLNLSKRRSFVRAEDKVVLFSQPIPNAIDIGSTRTSKAKFWVGTGIVENRSGEYFERILSPKQFDEVKSSGKTTEINLLDLPNFGSILEFDHRLDFLRN